MKKEELYMEIVNICSDWVSLDFIAATINRNSGYLLDNIIPSMLKEELIERMYPQVPRHPKQKYKTKKSDKKL